MRQVVISSIKHPFGASDTQFRGPSLNNAARVQGFRMRALLRDLFSADPGWLVVCLRGSRSALENHQIPHRLTLSAFLAVDGDSMIRGEVVSWFVTDGLI